MKRKTLKPLGMALAVSLLVISLASCAEPNKAAFDELASYKNQKIDWKKCYTKRECATLLVPIDYSDLALGTFRLELLKLPAKNQKKKIGSLVLNPGGPGGSGVDYAYVAQYLFSPDLLDTYDIVGFDPRGVAKSEPIRCLNDQELDAINASDSKPDSPEEVQRIADEAKTFAQKCIDKNPYLAHYSTENSARDMDILRAALGEQKLNYVGKSYGTYLGTLYAYLFPDNVGRMVLDGAIDPDVPSWEQNLTQAIGFDGALTSFLQECATQDNCPLPKNLSDAQLKVKEILQSAATKPLPQKKPRYKGDDRQVTESLILTGIASALYDDSEGWPQLRTAFKEALNGYGDTFLELADIYSGRSLEGIYKDNQFDSGAVINCLDWPEENTNIDVITARAMTFQEKAPIFGPYLAYSSLACATLPKEKINKLSRPALIAEINSPPILIIGTTRDPATPYAWAKSLHEILTNSILLTANGDGHTGQGRGSACIDDPIDKYLLTGAIPKKGLSCRL